MINTAVRIWAEISRPALSMRLRASRPEQFGICEISFELKDSIALSKKAIRGWMEMAARFLEAEASSSPIGKSTLLLAGTLRRPCRNNL